VESGIGAIATQLSSASQTEWRGVAWSMRERGEKNEALCCD